MSKKKVTSKKIVYLIHYLLRDKFVRDKFKNKIPTKNGYTSQILLILNLLLI